MKRALALLLLGLGILLPHRVKILYVEMLGWFAQLFHAVFRSLLDYLIREIDRREAGRSGAGRSTDAADPPPSGSAATGS